MTSACLPRSREALLAVVARVDPEAPQYQPHDVTGDGVPETFCNVFAADVCEEMGAELPRVRANAQLAWLDSETGVRAWWSPCSRVAAVAEAEAGKLVLVGWANPTGHGHIAVVVPAAAGFLAIAQAGATCFRSRSLASGFGVRPVKFWVHP